MLVLMLMLMLMLVLVLVLEGRRTGKPEPAGGQRSQGKAPPLGAPAARRPSVPALSSTLNALNCVE